MANKKWMPPYFRKPKNTDSRTLPTHKSKNVISRAQQEHCCRVAKKVLKHFEMDTALIDVFTKKQKEELFKVYYETPTVKPEKENTVPRQYVKNIQAGVYKFMKNNFWGNPENQLTYMEFAVYGMSFLSNLHNMYKWDASFVTGTPQEETAKLIYEKCYTDENCSAFYLEILMYIWSMTGSYSKVNFRMYGCTYQRIKIPLACGCCSCVKIVFLLTVQESVSKKFIVNNIERKAFQVFYIHFQLERPGPITLQRDLLLPKPKFKIFPWKKNDKRLNVYIQSHTLHRIKERFDLVNPEQQAHLIQAILNSFRIMSFKNQILLSCMIKDIEHLETTSYCPITERPEGEFPIGYFTFFIQGDDLVMNTFLPLTSNATPEGKKLQELLSISKEEINYLGMDKISFFFKVDFEQIPKLKQALVESNIWQTKLALESLYNYNKSGIKEISVDANKTRLVKDFFDKLQENSRSENGKVIV